MIATKPPTRARSINGTAVCEQLWSDMAAVRNSGGRVWLSTVGDAADHGCGNCGGIGFLFLQTVVGGPFDGATKPPHGVMNVFDGGKWFHAKTRQYTCPKCNGGA